MAQLAPILVAQLAPISVAQLAPILVAQLAPILVAQLAPILVAQLAPFYPVGGGVLYNNPQEAGIIMETTDGGENWTTLFSTDSLYINKIFVVASGQYQKLIAFANNKEGSSIMVWTFIDTQFQNWIVEPIAYRPYKPQLFNNAIFYMDFFMESNNLNKLENTLISIVKPDVYLFDIDSSGIVVINHHDIRSISVSNDIGLTWDTLVDFPSSFAGNSANYAKIKKINNTLLIKGSYSGLVARSIDNGSTWSTNYGAPDFHSIIVSDKALYGIGTLNRIFKTENMGEEWIVQGSLNGSPSNSGLYFYNEQFGFAFGENGQILKTINGGCCWNK